MCLGIGEGQLEVCSGWSRVVEQKNETRCKSNAWFEIFFFLQLC
jgi:hypothetical protein